MNHLKPQIAKIKKITKVTDTLAIFTISSKIGYFKPGQFFMLEIPGHGEAPFTPTNYPSDREIEFLIQKKENGTFTQKLFSLKSADTIMLRGPYGNGFDFTKMKNKNIILIAGGCGLAPIKSALEYLYRHSSSFRNIQLFYGVNTPNDFAYKNDLKSKTKKIEILFIVAKPSKSYRGNVGFIDKLIDKNTIKNNSSAILCGPPQMYDNTIKKLISLGLRPEDIFLQLERKMHCGIGQCQHCTCGDKYVCLDGPVFSYKQLLRLDIKI